MNVRPYGFSLFGLGAVGPTEACHAPSLQGLRGRSLGHAGGRAGRAGGFDGADELKCFKGNRGGATEQLCIDR